MIKPMDTLITCPAMLAVRRYLHPNNKNRYFSIRNWVVFSDSSPSLLKQNVLRISHHDRRERVRSFDGDKPRHHRCYNTGTAHPGQSHPALSSSCSMISLHSGRSEVGTQCRQSVHSPPHGSPERSSNSSWFPPLAEQTCLTPTSIPASLGGTSPEPS